MGNGIAKNPIETGIVIMGGDDILVNWQAFVLHLSGVKFNAVSAAGPISSNAECETGSNWTRVYENKTVRIVKFIYKLA